MSDDEKLFKMYAPKVYLEGAVANNRGGWIYGNALWKSMTTRSKVNPITNLEVDYGK